MRRVLCGSTAALLLTVLAAGTVLANDSRHCDPGLLDGLYVFTASGFATPPGAPAAPRAIIEVLRFHGDGTVTTPYVTISLNGTVPPAGPGGSGTYTITALDPPEGVCTGILTFSDAPNPSFNLVIAPKGERVWLLMRNGGTVFEGHAVKVAR